MVLALIRIATTATDIGYEKKENSPYDGFAEAELPHFPFNIRNIVVEQQFLPLRHDNVSVLGK